MGKIRFYCEYCDRSFLDDLEVRKKHLNGTLHIRQRKQYYNKFRDARTILEEESNAEQCKRYLNFNNCPFGDNCKYSHYTQADFENLRQQAETDEAAKLYTKSVEACLENIPKMEKINSWLLTRLHSYKQPSNGKTLFSDVVNNINLPILEGFVNLPPSLQPWPLNVSDNVVFSEWG